MKSLAKILALYFLLGGMMPGSDFGQLGKLTSLLEHYQVHRQMATLQGKVLTFGTFVAAHFWQPDSHHHNDGGQSHNELPLKVVNVFSPVLSEPISFVLSAPTIRLALKATANDELQSAPYAGAVFRPPIVS